MDNNQNNPASPNIGNTGAAEPVAPIAPNGANAKSQAAPVEPGTPVDNLVQDISKTAQPAAPAQPAAAAQPTVTAQPAAPAAQPVVSAPASQPQPVVQPYGAPKKSHAGLIIGIIVVVLLAAAGVGGFLFYQQHEKPERVLADGMVKLLTTKSLTANSVIDVKLDDDDLDKGDLESMKFTLLTARNEKYEASIDAKVEFKLQGYEAMNAEAEIMEGENAIYFRLTDSGNISSVVSKIAEEEGANSVDVKSILESAFTSVGDSWYEIPYSKIDESGSFKKSIDCIREKSANITEGENWNKILDVYQKNPFITVTEGAKIESVNGYKKYPLTIDEDKADEFFDAISDEEFVKEIESCTDSNLNKNSSLNIRNNSLYDYDDEDDDYDWLYEDDDDDDWLYGSSDDDALVGPKVEKDDDEKYEIVVGIKPWSHEIVWIGMTAETGSYTKAKISADINLSYTADITTPGDTKSIDELVEKLQSSINDSSKQAYYSTYCTKEQKYSGYDSEAECKRAVDEAFGGNASSNDVEDLLDNLKQYI